MVIQKMSGFAEISGLDGDDVHVELPQLVTNGRAQPLDGVLRRAVDGETRISVQSGNATHIQNSAWKSSPSKKDGEENVN